MPDDTKKKLTEDQIKEVRKLKETLIKGGKLIVK